MIRPQAFFQGGAACSGAGSLQSVDVPELRDPTPGLFQAAHFVQKVTSTMPIRAPAQRYRARRTGDLFSLSPPPSGCPPTNPAADDPCALVRLQGFAFNPAGPGHRDAIAGLPRCPATSQPRPRARCAAHQRADVRNWCTYAPLAANADDAGTATLGSFGADGALALHGRLSSIFIPTGGGPVEIATPVAFTGIPGWLLPCVRDALIG